MINQKIFNYFLDKGILLSDDLINEIYEDKLEDLFNKIKKRVKGKDNLLILNKDLFLLLTNSEEDIDTNWLEFEKAKFLVETGKDDKIYFTFLDIFNYHISKDKKQIMDSLLKEVKEPVSIELSIEQETKEDNHNVVVVKSYIDKDKKREIQDFVGHYNVRFDFLRKLLRNRQELQGAISINRLKNKEVREEISLIGMVKDKSISKNGNIVLTLEDITGEMKIVISKNKNQLFEEALEITLDEVIGITGTFSGSIVFVNSVFFPDIPKSHELKKINEEIYVAFISDIHIGSKNFLKKDFLKFIDWINGKVGSKEQRETALNVKYLFVVGDTVDGVGIYPGQEEDSEIKDYYEQYNVLAGLFKQIRNDIKIIICGGQHDAMRLAEPQTVMNKDYAKALYELTNMIMVTNPSLVNIHSSEDFEGFNILMYHGASFHHFISNIDSLRNKKPNENPSIMLKYLLKRRHLAPTHGSSLFIPDPEEDPLLITKVPDFFVAGDMHRSDVSSYNNITLINCSCWQSQTDFEIKVGNNPDPSKVPIVNLKTREIKIMRFGEDGSK